MDSFNIQIAEVLPKEIGQRKFRGTISGPTTTFISPKPPASTPPPSTPPSAATAAASTPASTPPPVSAASTPPPVSAASTPPPVSAASTPPPVSAASGVTEKYITFNKTLLSVPNNLKDEFILINSSNYATLKPSWSEGYLKSNEPEEAILRRIQFDNPGIENLDQIRDILRSVEPPPSAPPISPLPPKAPIEEIVNENDLSNNGIVADGSPAAGGAPRTAFARSATATNRRKHRKTLKNLRQR